jgi:CheY-like chemotaxis protein
MDSEAIEIVIVDDEEDGIAAMAMLLELEGYEVRSARSAEEALTLIEQCKPHCVLFDILMPGMGGEELCRRLRGRYGDDIVLIAVSGCDDERVNASFDLADHFFTKPVDPKSLNSVLHR